MLLSILLWNFSVARDFELLSEVKISLPAVAQSVTWAQSVGLATWLEGESVAFCILDKCEGRSLTPGSQSFAFACENCPSFEVLSASDKSVWVTRLSLECACPALHPRDLTGLYLDNMHSLVLWTALSSAQGDYEVFGCLLNEAGNKIKCSFVLNAFSQGDQLNPTAALVSDGVMVAWTSSGYHSGLFAQKLSLDCTKIDTEIALLEGSRVHSPQLVGETVLISKSSEVNPQVVLGLLPLSSKAFVPLATFEEFHEHLPISGLRWEADIVTLHGFSDMEGRGHIQVQKVAGDCVQSVYRTSHADSESHAGGRLLSVSAAEVRLSFYDQVRRVLTVQRLTNPPNSVCYASPQVAFPEWRAPKAPREEPWKKIVTVSFGCLSFIVFVVLVMLAVKSLRRRRHLTLPPTPTLGAPEESQSKDNSMMLFEIGTPDKTS